MDCLFCSNDHSLSSREPKLRCRSGCDGLSQQHPSRSSRQRQSCPCQPSKVVLRSPISIFLAVTLASLLLAASVSTSWAIPIPPNEQGDGDNNDNPQESSTTKKGNDHIKIVRSEGLLAITEQQQQPVQAEDDSNQDPVEDSIYDALQGDAVCDGKDASCRFEWEPPDSTIETETIASAVAVAVEQATAIALPNNTNTSECPSEQQQQPKKNITIDKHWGSNPNILRMRDQLRDSGTGFRSDNRRPPIFLMPGLASTRLNAWRFKACPQNPILSDIKVQDNVWMNLNLLMQMSAIDGACFIDCLTLGYNQTDSNHPATGCKLRPEEGLDAISSLSPGGVAPNLIVGGTNTVYAWLIQWLADNLGYDVGNIVGLPYDWRLSPDKMEERDGFLTLTRRKMEAAVRTNGAPGIMVAHSMGNTIFRYFLAWLRIELQEEAYNKHVQEAKRRAQQNPVDHALQQSGGRRPPPLFRSWLGSGADILVSDQDILDTNADGSKQPDLWERAKIEGDANFHDWVERHIWTYVGLSAPLLGAVNPLRATLSGENMGLPFSNKEARDMEKSFGSTHTISPISSKMAFCDEWDVADAWDEEPDSELTRKHADSHLSCLDDIATEIDTSVDKEIRKHYDPWYRHPTLKRLLLDRIDWDTDLPMISITRESCEVKERAPCSKNSTTTVGPRDVQSGQVFTTFSETWNEEGDPMRVKREQLRESFWDTGIPNILNQTWERPLIKHVIMAYGVDISTEVGYEYVKTERDSTSDCNIKEDFDAIPHLRSVLWETAGGKVEEQRLDLPKPKIWSKKQERRKLLDGPMRFSGDGSVPYISLSWAHTWLLHGIRARRLSSEEKDGPTNPLDEIQISHRPEGGMEWVQGAPPKRFNIQEEKRFEESDDTGTSHPHGTKYKPEMRRYHTDGKSRTTGIEYTTSVIEAVTIEHKETTRNYDILAAVFSDVLQFMHDDFSLLADEES